MDFRWHAAGMDEVPDDDRWLSPAEAARVAGMRYPKRRSEFRLGRWTAKATLAAVLDAPIGRDGLAGIEIRAAPTGAPEPYRKGAPAPVSLSMTDRADWAVCLVGPPGVDVGCDLELVEPRSDAFVADFLTEAEQRAVVDAGRSRDVMANLVWSAKESALKVLRTGLRRDTISVEVTVTDQPAEGAEGWRRLEVRDRQTGAVFPGWWQRFDAFLLTTATSGPAPPPVALLSEDRLRRAQPSHRWMAAQEQLRAR